jgi:isohexenylglutaconyl-CoA hydratase
MTPAPVLIAQQHGVLFATLNRPQTRHALSPEVLDGLESALAQAQADAHCRALVLRGTNGFFCAGGNVGNFQSRLDEGASSGNDPVAASNRVFGRFMQRLATLPVSVIAAVEGAAMGGGMGLACAADVVLATRDAKFALSETSLGIIPAQIAPFVVERIGQRVALRMGLSGERVSGDTALHLGLVDELAADGAALDELLARWLSNIGACAPQANRMLKPLLRRCGQEDRDALLDDAARQFAACMRGEGTEGIAAFREKRAAAWRCQFSATDVRAAQGTCA